MALNEDCDGEVSLIIYFEAHSHQIHVEDRKFEHHLSMTSAAYLHVSLRSQEVWFGQFLSTLHLSETMMSERKVD